MKKLIALLLCAALLSLCACTANVQSGKTVIAASFYPIYIFTLNLVDGIDGIELKCMAEENVGCLHDYQLLAKDARLLADAKILVINGAGMESFIEDAYENNDSLCVIDSSEGVELLLGECGDEKSHAHSHAHKSEANAHIWMSVENAEKQVENISSALCRELPAYSEKISKNCENYISRLKVLKDELLKECGGIGNIPVITFHEAYDYTAKELGLSIEASIESDEGGEPTAKELASLSKIIKEKRVKALFVEPYYKGSAANILERETGVSVYVLNPVTSGEKTLTAYEDIMRENIKTVLKAVEA